jgi:hypothetical protein
MVLVLTACGSTSSPPPASTQTTAQQPPAAAAPSAAVYVAHQPPTAKDVIDAVIASGNVPLTVSPSCANAGTEPSDTTIGQYLAGFLAELSAPDKKNWIETKIEPGRSAAGEAVTVSSLMIRHEDGDDRWGWGVQFQVRTSDRLVLTESFSCVGAG